MKLFVFGLGYSALHFVRTRRDRFPLIAGTARDQAKTAELAREGLAVRIFSETQWDAAIVTELRDAEALLVSVPPGERDPVLAHFSEPIAAAPSLRSIVYLSTVGVYGDHGGGWVDETTALRPTSARSRERVETEEAWAAFGRNHGKAVHNLRLGGIYGPGRSGIDNLRRGRARRLVKPGQVFNRIHVEDIARAIEAAFLHEGSGGAWNVTDDLPAPPQDVVAYAADLIGMAPPPEIAFDGAELTPMARSFYSENKRVDNARLKRELGVSLAYPTYKEGLKALSEG